MSRILLVEDDRSLAASLKEWLTQSSYTVDVVHNGEDALYWLLNEEISVAILDWELPKMSGVEVCRRYRQAGGRIPILILTGRSKIDEKVEGLDSGADDYIPKPLELKEFLARLRALLRRGPSFHAECLMVSDLELDCSRGTVKRAGQPVSLSKKEFAILELLMRNPGRIFSAESLMKKVWSANAEITPETVRSHMQRLRTKLDDAGCGAPCAVKNVYGMGYKIEEL